MALVRSSRQFDSLQAATLRRLLARIPPDCPLVVGRAVERDGFRVLTLDERTCCQGRYQVVAAWIDGFVSAWSRLSRHTASRPPVSG